MEIAIIAGLAFVGYEINKNKHIKQPKGKIANNENAKFKTNDMNLPVGPQHFIKDKHTMLQVNNNLQTRELESFTGRDNTYQIKKEQENLFKPQENTQNIYGNQVMSDDVQNRYKSKHTCIKPCT